MVGNGTVMSDDLLSGIFSTSPNLSPRDVAEFTKAFLNATAVVRPGDTVILEVDDTERQVEELTELLKPFHKETGIHFLVLSSGARLARVERDES